MPAAVRPVPGLPSRVNGRRLLLMASGAPRLGRMAKVRYNRRCVRHPGQAIGGGCEDESCCDTKAAATDVDPDTTRCWNKRAHIAGAPFRLVEVRPADVSCPRSLRGIHIPLTGGLPGAVQTRPTPV